MFSSKNSAIFMLEARMANVNQEHRERGASAPNGHVSDPGGTVYESPLQAGTLFRAKSHAVESQVSGGQGHHQGAQESHWIFGREPCAVEAPRPGAGAGSHPVGGRQPRCGPRAASPKKKGPLS